MSTLKLFYTITLAVLITGCRKELLVEKAVSLKPRSIASTSFSTVTNLQTELSIQWNLLLGTGNYMTSNDFIEASSFSTVGQSYYVPKFLLSGTSPFYRAVNGSKHLVTGSSSGEGAYAIEGIVGYGFDASSAPAGTVNVFRSYSALHAGYTLSSPNYSIASYDSIQYLNKYGYPRYNSNTSLLSLNGTAIGIKSNRVAGGSIWELSWNGKQFVNTSDYGRLIQSSMNLGNGALPTEGGDKHFSANSSFCHGSPLIEAYNSGSTQVTTAVPLEWHNEMFNSTGNIHDLIIYKDFKLGKIITLDPTLSLGAFNYLKPQIAKYVTTFSTPVNLSEVHIEIPTGYLNMEFSRFFEVDATNSNLNAGLTEVLLNENESQQSPFHDAGGIVLATQGLDYAMGIYINIVNSKSTDDDPNSIYYFRNWRFSDTSKWSAGRYGNISAGAHQYTSYIIVGTLDEVRTAMRALSINGY